MERTIADDLIARDAKTVWHPYTPQREGVQMIPVASAQDAILIDPDGREYIDAIASWWVNLFGHNHPYLRQKVEAQWQQLDHVVFAGFTHAPAVELAEELLAALPGEQSRIFYSDNGSTAVEIALKMAIQYHRNLGKPRKRVVALSGAYHGGTFGAMSAGERGIFSAPFVDYLFDVEHISVPVVGKEQEALQQLTDLAEGGDVAAFIFEPLLQAANGMVMYSPEALDQLIAVCQLHGIVTIADEAVTGFGRTGKDFACDYLQHEVDIFCLTKGLTGGVLPMGATTCSSRVYQAFVAEDPGKALFHGHSYTGNPLVCAAASASLELLKQSETQQNIERVVSYFEGFCDRLREENCVENVRQLGAVIAFELRTGEARSYLSNIRDRLASFFLEHGVLLRPLGNTVYVLPPYCITDVQLNQVESAVFQALEHFSEELEPGTVAV